MEKTKEYKYAYFSVETIKLAFEKYFGDNKEFQSAYFRLKRDQESWNYDFNQQSEFFSDYRKQHDNSTIRIGFDEREIQIEYFGSLSQSISVSGINRDEIESIFEIFEDKYESSIQPPPSSTTHPVIFIGHGRSQQWRDLKDHLSDKHGFVVEAYETGARSGHSIRDILEDMSMKSTFALIVMTAEDEDIKGKLNPRPNVIHEAGLFQGKLGFDKAIVLVEDGTEIFSNLDGIQQLRFSKNNIKEVFGDIIATIKREFKL